MPQAVAGRSAGTWACLKGPELESVKPHVYVSTRHEIAYLFGSLFQETAMRIKLPLSVSRIIALCFVICLSTASQDQSASAVELLGLYEFENDFTDSSPYGNDPTVSFTIQIAVGAGFEGNAAAFPGQNLNDRGLEVPDGGQRPNGIKKTVGGWVKADPVLRGALNFGGFTPVDNEWVHGSVRSHVPLGVTINGDWQFLAATYSGEVAQLFIDSDSPIGTFENPSGLSTWGFVQVKSFFSTAANGITKPLLDNLFIFGDVLTNEQIALIRRNGVQGILEVAGLAETLSPLAISGGGETYRQDFDAMETRTYSGVMPNGWTDEQEMRIVHGLGLQEGPLIDGISTALGILNLGGTADAFDTTFGDFIATWDEDHDDNGLMEDADVIANGASDRALGIGRADGSSPLLVATLEIKDKPLRAFVFDWDLEVWGGDPESAFRGSAGGGFLAEANVGGQLYYSNTQSYFPGERFYTLLDRANTRIDPTLINGNEHSVRGITSGIVEVATGDGAVGNTVRLSFDANTGANGDGWISAVDNVRLRALAPGDADANGIVDVDDLLTLLAANKFNQGVADVTWAQGDFNADDQFNTSDLLAMLAFLSGQFPSDPYASEASDAVADVIVNSETGEVTIDLAGHTASAILIESAAEIFNGVEPEWDTTSQFPSTLPGELGNVLFTSTASGVDELGAVISQEFLGRDKEFYLQDLDFNILIASEGGALTKGNVIVVPEPSTWLLMLTGALLVGWRQVAKRHSPGKQCIATCIGAEE